MNFSIKNIFILTLVICLISLSANIYSFKKLKNNSQEENKTVENYKRLLEKQRQEILTLNDEKKQGSSIKPTKIKNNTQERNDSNHTKIKTTELENAATRFIEYAFNSSPETYSLRKKNAHNYMTDSLIKTIFTSDGIDEKSQDIETKAGKITVFSKSNDEKECIVFYNLQMEIISSGYKEENQNYVKLKFKKVDGKLKVATIEPINVVGGV